MKFLSLFGIRLQFGNAGFFGLMSGLKHVLDSGSPEGPVVQQFVWNLLKILVMLMWRKCRSEVRMIINTSATVTVRSATAKTNV
jgi:hypothetical protein